jgi:hypothetical protein
MESVESVRNEMETFKCELLKLEHIIKYFAERYGMVTVGSCLNSMNHA